MRKILVSVAPVSAQDTLNDPQAIARDVAACWKAGAGMVHLHCRDAHGSLTPDTARLAETVALIRAACPIVIEISTGGVSNLTIAERCETCKPDWVECNSLNVGSVNLGEAVYANPIGDVRYCVEQIVAHGKVPEVEVFEIGMIHTTALLAKQFALPKPLLLALVLGHEGAMPATVPALDLMLQGLRDSFPRSEEILWGITHAHRTDWALVEAALERGAHAVRIGFEDSAMLSATQCAATNAELVADFAKVLAAHSLAPATPQEIRTMLGIPQ